MWEGESRWKQSGTGSGSSMAVWKTRKEDTGETQKKILNKKGTRK